MDDEHFKDSLMEFLTPPIIIDKNKTNGAKEEKLVKMAFPKHIFESSGSLCAW